MSSVSVQATPTLEDVLQLAIDSHMIDVNTSMPGVVENYYYQTQTADVRPALMRKYRDRGLVEMPLINAVPVVFPSGGGGQTSFTFPLVKGDPVMLVFAQRSLEVWKSKGGVVNPGDPRRFNLSDAVAYPGGRSPGAPLTTANSANLRIAHGQALLEMDTGGRITFGTNGGNELLDLFDQTLTKLQATLDKLKVDTTNTMLGPMGLNGVATYTQLSTDVAGIKTKLDALKGVQ